MPTTAHTYQCISRYDPALADGNFDKHDAAFPKTEPEGAKPSQWRKYRDGVAEGKHDAALLEVTSESTPIVYTLRPLTRPEMQWAREILQLHGATQYTLALASIALVSADGPRPVTAMDVAGLRDTGAGLIRRTSPDAWLWSDDDVMPEAATIGLAEHIARRWNLSKQQRTFRRTGGDAS
jgi:hypothetical protein